MILIDKVVAPQPVGPMSIYKHDIPDADLRRAAAADEDLYNGRLHEAHVIRLAGSYVVFSKNEPLPPGGFSDNYVGVHSHRGFVAVKRLRTLPCDKRDKKARCQWTREADIDKEVDLAKKVGLRAAPFFAVQTQTKAYIVSPLFEGDAMYLAALGETRFPRAVLLHRFLQDVARHLEHIHGQGILHNDVKPNNVLISRQEEALRFVMCDYGLSCALNTHDYPGGNAWYGAPEETLEGQPEARSDIYSLGISCMTLINNCNPFEAVFAPFGDALPSSKVREQAYLSFEAIRLDKPAPVAEYGDIFGKVWDAMARQIPAELLEIIRGMVALPLDGKDARLGVEDVLRRLAAWSPEQEALDRWNKSVATFKPGAITQAKRQARIVEDALINRGRLEPTECVREHVGQLRDVKV